MLQWILKIPWVPKWTGYIWLSSVSGSCERSIAPSGSIQCGQLCDWKAISFSLRKFSSWIYIIRLHSHFNIFGWHSVQLEYEVCCTSFASNPVWSSKLYFPCFIILSSLRTCYRPILANSHHGGNKSLNTYTTICHASSAHQTKAHYCTSGTDGRHVYIMTQPIKM